MCALVLAILLFPDVVFAQAVHWDRLNTDLAKLDPTLKPAPLSARERQNIVASLQRQIPDNSMACMANGDRPPELMAAPLGRPNLVYVWTNCLGSSNGSRWLVEMEEGRPRILAALTGWGLGVQPQTSHGLHDFVVGWHESAFETGLGWYRFDGTKYRQVSIATAYSTDERGTERMALERARCAKEHRTCHLIRYRQPS